MIRNYGQRENWKIRLSVEQGRVQHLPERDRFSTSFDGQKRI